MIVRPVHDRILVKKDGLDTLSKGGIVIPDAAADAPTRGTVMAVGPGKYSEKTAVLIPMTLNVGDRVLMHSAAGSQLNVGGEIYHCLPEADVWCVITDE